MIETAATSLCGPTGIYIYVYLKNTIIIPEGMVCPDQRPRHPACATAKRIDGRENSDTWEDMDPTHPQEEWIQP